MNPPVSRPCAQVLVWIGISLGFRPLSGVSISSKSSLLPLSACCDWFTGRRRARLWSVLSSEVEQPLAEQRVALFQVLYQVSLLLHHILQTGALSVANKKHIWNL